MGRLEDLIVVPEFLGPFPVVNRLVRRLRIDDLLQRSLGPHEGRGPSPAACLGVLLRNILLERGPLYALPEWAQRFRPAVLGLAPDHLRHLNDDRIGRALDRLFDTDRACLLTEVVVRAIQEFHLDLSEIHNDSTTLPLAGQYVEADGRLHRGKKTVRITYGHSKDHRPDLKQLLWVLTVTADGMVPVHYTVHDGNTNDSPTHWETWETVRRLAGRAGFLYVADSKACVSEFLLHVHQQGGRIITVVPRNRKEDGWFREYLQTHEPAWVEVAREEDPRSKYGPPIVWRAVESPMPSGEGFRVIWVWNSRKEEQDRGARQALIAAAVRRLEGLEKRLQSPRCKIRTKEGVIAAAERAVGETGRRWVEYTICEEGVAKFRQERRGRPGKDTRYHREMRLGCHVAPVLRQEVIAFDAKCDGKWPLLTNAKDLGIERVVAAYRDQPRLEKRHEQLKTVYGAAPMLLKKVTRMEGLLFVYFLVLLVEALLEREIRQAMEREKVVSLPLYPEGRPSIAPTTNVVFQMFDHVLVQRLVEEGKTVREIWPELTGTQRKVLRLLGVPESVYRSDS